jgi:hypothetical protein
MRLGERLQGPLAVLVLLLLPGCDKPTTPTKTESDAGSPTADVELQAAEIDEADATGTTIAFDDAQLFFELNSTDNDLGLQLFLDTEGWKRVRVLDPARNEIVFLQAERSLAKLGITELRFESAEPSPEEVLGLFPPGQYRFRGRTVEGDQLASNVILSHEFPPAPTFSPSGGEVVDPKNTVVEWNAPGAEQVELIIEQDELGHVLDITLSGSSKRLRVPPQFLRPGMEYKIEILSISENGNRIIAESTFRTGSS